MSRTMIVRVTSTMFETADGREIPHLVPFNPKKIPSVEEFHLTLMASFSAKIYGKRSADRKREQKEKGQAA